MYLIRLFKHIKCIAYLFSYCTTLTLILTFIFKYIQCIAYLFSYFLYFCNHFIFCIFVIIQFHFILYHFTSFLFRSLYVIFNSLHPVLLTILLPFHHWPLLPRFYPFAPAAPTMQSIQEIFPVEEAVGGRCHNSLLSSCWGRWHRSHMGRRLNRPSSPWW